MICDGYELNYYNYNKARPYVHIRDLNKPESWIYYLDNDPISNNYQLPDNIKNKAIRYASLMAFI